MAYVDTKAGQTKVSVTHRTEGDSIQGCYVSNTAWVKDAILNGDDLSAKEGDSNRAIILYLRLPEKTDRIRPEPVIFTWPIIGLKETPTGIISTVGSGSTFVPWAW